MQTENFIVCDDVRQENTGKYILIGVYLDDIILSQLPARPVLRIWGQLFFDGFGVIAGAIGQISEIVVQQRLIGILADERLIGVPHRLQLRQPATNAS